MSINGLGFGTEPQKDLFGVKQLASDSLDALRDTTLQPEDQDPKPIPQPVAPKLTPEIQQNPQNPQDPQGPSEDNTDQILALEDEESEKRKAEFMIAWEHAFKDPERAALAYQIADERGIPRDRVTSNIEIATEVLKREAVNYDKLKDESPWTLSVFQSQERKNQSSDDIENYQALEKEVNGFGDAMQAGYLDMYRGYLGLQVAMGLIDKEYDRNDPTQWVSEETRQTLLDLELNINALRENPAWYAPIAEEAAQLSIEVPVSLAAGKGSAVVGGAIGSAVPVVGTAAGAAVGEAVGFFAAQTAMSGAQEMGNKYLEMRSKGYTHEEAFGASINTAIATGVLDAISGQIGRIPWKQMMRPGSAIRKSLLEGVAEASARQFTDKAKEKIWKDALKNYAVGGASEIVTETVQQASSMVIESMAYADLDKQDRKRITSVPSIDMTGEGQTDWKAVGSELWATAVDTAIASSVFSGLGPAGNYYRSKVEIDKAFKTEAKLQEIIAKASGIKTLERDPEGARRELALLMEKNGVAKMHIYASELRDFIRFMDDDVVAKAAGGDKDKENDIRQQLAAESPTEKKLREAMPELMKQLDEAADGDVDLEVDSSQLLASLSRADAVKVFARYMRVTPDSISVAAAEKNRALLDEMKKEADAMLELDRQDKQERIASKDKVQKIIEGQLLKSGMSAEDAQASSAHQTALIVLQSENFGMMPDQYLAEYGATYMSDADYSKAVKDLQNKGTLVGVSVSYEYGDEGASQTFRLGGMSNPTQQGISDAIAEVEEQIALATERGMKADDPQMQSMLNFVERAKEYRDRPEKKLNQFAGSLALTADKDAQEKAKTRLAAGDDPEEVRRATGWFVGNDGNMRFEISDRESALVHQPNLEQDGTTVGQSVTLVNMAKAMDRYRKQLNKIYKNEEDNHSFYLGELLKHDKLFAAYPWLRSIPVVFPVVKTGEEVSRTSSLVNGKLLLDKANWKDMMQKGQVPSGVLIKAGAMDPAELRILLAHEISHAIQSFENFGAGGNPDMAGLLDDTGNSRSLNTKLATKANARYTSIHQFGDKLVNAFTYDMVQEDAGSRKSLLAWVQKVGSLPAGVSEEDAISFANQLRSQLMKSPYYRDLSVAGFKGLKAEIAREIRGISTYTSKFFWYSLLDGEREAAAVERRIDMDENIAAISNPLDDFNYPTSTGIVIPVDAKLKKDAMVPSTVNNQDFDDDPNGPDILESPGINRNEQVTNRILGEEEEEQQRAFVDLNRMIVALTKNADFTSIAHESQHLYEKWLVDVAGNANAPIHLREQAMRFFTWAGIPGDNLEEKRANYFSLPAEERVKLSESLAYNYELYLAEGNAPVPELQEYYGAVSKLVRGVYKNVVKDLNKAYKEKYGADLPGMDDDIRSFFDRMLASEEQIRTTMKLRRMSPVIIGDSQAKQLNISEAELQNIRDLERVAFDESVEDLTAKSIRGLVWVKNKIARRNKELAKQADEVEAKLRIEVEAEIGEQRPYKILKIFSEGDMTAIDQSLINGPELLALHQERNKLKEEKAQAKKKKEKGLVKEIDGKIADVNKTIKEAEKRARKSKQPRPKIDLESLSKMYPPADFERIKEALGAGVGRPLGRDGVDASQVATFFGYDSAIEMIDELVSAPPFDKAVEKRVKERMLNEHSELAKPQQRELAVVEAIHNEARIKLIATQHNIIQRTLMMQFALAKPDVADGLRQVREEILYVLEDINQLEADLESAKQSGNPDTIESMIKQIENRKAELDRLSKAAAIPNASMAEITATAAFAAKQLADDMLLGSVDVGAWRRREERLSINASEALNKGDLQRALQLLKQQLIANNMIQSLLLIKKEQGTIMEFLRRFGQHGKNDASVRDSDHMILGAELLRLAGYGDLVSLDHLRKYEVVKKYNEPLIKQYEMLMEMVKSDSDKKGPLKMTIKDLRVFHNIMLGVWNTATKERSVIRDKKLASLEQADAELVKQISVSYMAVKSPPPGGSKKQSEKATGGSLFTEHIVLDEETGAFGFFDNDEDGPGGDGGEGGEGDGTPEVVRVPNLSQGKRGAEGSFSILENESILTIGATLTRMQHWCKYMDMDNPNGPFTMYIWRPIKNACLNYREAKLRYKERYEAIIRRIQPGLTWHGIPAPALGFTFENKAQLLGAIQHMGTQSNYDEMLRARNWNHRDFEAFIAECWRTGVVTNEDMDALQDIWNLNAELLPQAQQVHYNLYSNRFVPIPPRRINTPWGTYPGGYIPIHRDPRDRRFSKGKEAKIQNAIDALYGNAQMALPTTGRNWAMRRGGNQGWLVMDIDLSQQHIDSVLRFVHLMPAIRSVTNLIGNRNGLFAQALRFINPKIITHLIIPHLETVARQGTSLASSLPWADSVLRAIRVRSGYDVMHGLIQNAIANVSGWAVYLDSKSWDPTAMRRLSSAMLRSLFVRGTARFVMDRSRLINQRHEQRLKETEDETKRMLKDPSRSLFFGMRVDNPFSIFLGSVKDATYGRLQDAWGSMAYIFQRIVQDPIDRAVWLAEYEYQQQRNMVDGRLTLTEQELIARADAEVELSQGSNDPENVAASEVGNELYKIFTPLMSWSTMMLNRSAGKFLSLMRDLGFDASNVRPRHLPQAIAIYLSAMWFPMIMGSHVNLIAANGVKDSNEDDEWTDDYLKWLLKMTAQQGPAMIPGAGNAINTFINHYDDVPYNDKMASVPAVTAMESAARTSYNLIAPMFTGEETFTTGRDYKDLATTIALMFRLYPKPLAKPMSYQMELDNNRADPTSEWDYWRGMVTGTVSPESRR